MKYLLESPSLPKEKYHYIHGLQLDREPNEYTNRLVRDEKEIMDFCGESLKIWVLG